jgi:hypothetical protein
VADIKAHLGRAYVEALGHAEAAARDARAEYCARHVEPACLPAPGY